MKICILTHTFPKYEGDTAAPFMKGVAEGIASTGSEVFVLTPYSLGFKNSLNKKYKLVTYKYIFPNFLHKLGYSKTLDNDMKVKPLVYLLSPFLYIFGILALWKLVKKEKIDLINAHWILPNGFMASVVSFFTGVPVVSTLPGSDVYIARKNFFFKLMATFAANTSKIITSNSYQLIEDLFKICEKRYKWRVIVYGVDPVRFRPIREDLNCKKQLGIDKDKIVILGVGRLVDKKGFKYLIEAAPIVLKNNKEIIFILVGDGDQKLHLEKLTKKLEVDSYFKFVGTINYDKLVDYYNICDIFVLPSVRDEKGNLDDQSVSVVEAMACGKPIITTNFPGYKLVVNEGENGFLTPEKNSNSIAKVLTKLIESQKLRDIMGKKSRDMVMGNFTWEAIGKQYTALFKSLK